MGVDDRSVAFLNDRGDRDGNYNTTGGGTVIASAASYEKTPEQNNAVGAGLG
jgi:hypothetical protein